MSYDPRLAGRPYGASDEEEGTRKGSVRAARERMQAARIQGQLPDRSRIVGLPQRPNQLVSQYSAPGQQRPPPQSNLTPPDSRGNPNALSPTPQWPLSNNTEDVLDSGPGLYPAAPDRGVVPRQLPPQRPPRPTSDELPIQPTSPSDYRGSFQSDDYLSPVSATLSSRPLTTSSAASEASSLGSIPDFPVPQPPVPMPTVQPLPRRQPTLGPPPSARRGPSSYYTHMSYVSPIIEESERNSEAGIRSHHGSFASSNVIPTNTDDFYLEKTDLSDDEETVTSDYGRESRASDHDEKSELVQQPALVRQASLGRRTKPSLMTIKSVDSLDKKAMPVKRKPITDNTGSGAGAAGIGSAVLAARDGIAGRRSPTPPSISLSTGTGLLDASSSSSESLNSLKNTKPGFAVKSRALDPEKGELDAPIHPLQQGARQAQQAERLDRRRPPRLDIDAVRDAEARGSLTSLPELIRRATKLAANLDRGKTASRLGLDFWEAGAPKEKYDSRRSGSLSDMLAAFPPPGEATPTGGRTPDPKNMSKWPSARGAGATSSGLSSRDSKGRRRCCGMPMWTFVTLLIVLLFLIAAAVVIPVVLIVIPKMKNNQAPSAAQSTTTNTNSAPTAQPTSSGQTDQCSGVITCENNGVAILNADRSCNCVCINGFTGKTCATKGDAGCTTTNLLGSAENATIGSGIPRLINSAQANFSVPLEASQLLPLFSNLSMSCSTENALVTFNGLASRAALTHEASLEPSRSLPLSELAQHDQGLRRLDLRQAIGVVGNSNDNVAATATATASGVSATSTTPVSSNATALDFARIGVLLALQESKTLNTAANAQSAVQDFLTKNREGSSDGSSSIKMGTFTIDLVKLSIAFTNGTTITARPNATTT